VFALLFPAALRCQPSSPEPSRGGPSRADPAPTTQVSITTPRDSLRLQLEVPAQVPAGAPVPIVLRVTNTGAAARELYLRGRTVAFDVTIAREGGAVVWRRLDGQAIEAIVQLRVLQPGEALTLEHRWDQRDRRGEPVAPGIYTVQGALLTDEPEPRRTTIRTLRITPR